MTKEAPRVLVIDDDEFDTRLTQRAISKTLPEAEILTCDDGEAALQELQTLASAPESNWPTLILMDFRMPRMGCLDVLKELGRSPMLERVPVVLFSSSVGPTDVQECLQVGVREYVEKPTDPDKYARSIEAICTRHVVML